MRSLRCLYAMENQLTELPSELGRMSGLEALEVAYNRLRSIPISIAYVFVYVRRVRVSSASPSLLGLRAKASARMVCTVPLLLSSCPVSRPGGRLGASPSFSRMFVCVFVRVYVLQHRSVRSSLAHLCALVLVTSGS